LFRFHNKNELGEGGKNKVFIENYTFLTQQMTVLTGSTWSVWRYLFFVCLQVNARKMDQIMKKKKMTTAKKV